VKFLSVCVVVAACSFALQATTATAQLSGVGQVLQRANEAAASAAGTKSLAEFRTWATTYVANPQANVTLPQGWFDQHFDGDTARALKAEYQKGIANVNRLPMIVAKQKAQGKTNLVVSMHADAIDSSATGWQNAALQRMTKSTPLYSLRMLAPGKTSGFSLLSFVYADGRFAFAGKFSALHEPKDLATKVLCTTAIDLIEKTLREKGLIKTSAIEHLQNVGVLH